MLNYTKTIQSPRLVITHDDCAENPRVNDNIGHFITISSRHLSPDDNQFYAQTIQETGNIATSLNHHIELITERLNANDVEIVLLLPIYRFEHGIVRYGIGNVQGFDYSNCGLYVVTKDSLENYLGEDISKSTEEIEEIIEGEIEIYNKWVNGEVYYYRLYDNEGELFDTCGGFYDIDSIKESLPIEFKNEDLEEYIK